MNRNLLSKWPLCLFWLAVAAFVWFVWPTPWKEYKRGQQNLRVHRITGTTQVLQWEGWEDVH